MNQKYWIGISYLSQISYNSLNPLFQQLKTAENIWKAKDKEIYSILINYPKTAEYIISQRKTIDLDKDIEKLNKLNIKLISINDLNYPPSLKQIKAPPFLLYVKGKYSEEDKLAISVVGTRRYTTYGKIVTGKLTEELVLYGFTIISGLAYGIDTFAHESAIENNGRTIAVLGTGLDSIYPRENMKLAEKIIEKGALISEFPLGTGPIKYNFPQRNRIISGLSMGVLIVEGKIKSGAMITAGYALEEGREVFCIPGQITNNKSEGPNNLIKEGAKLVQNIGDILNELSLKINFRKEKKVKQIFSTNEQQIINLLIKGPKTVDQISEALNMELPKLALLLVELESKNFIESIGAGKYVCY